MKVVHIVECAGGVERYLEMLVPRLKIKGIKQSLVCSRLVNTSKLSNSLDDCVVTDMSRTLNPLSVLKIVKQIREAIVRLKPDIVYCHSSFAGVFGRLAAVGTHCRVVYNPHGWAFNMKQS